VRPFTGKVWALPRCEIVGGCRRLQRGILTRALPPSSGSNPARLCGLTRPMRARSDAQPRRTPFPRCPSHRPAFTARSACGSSSSSRSRRGRRSRRRRRRRGPRPSGGLTPRSSTGARCLAIQSLEPTAWEQLAARYRMGANRRVGSAGARLLCYSPPDSKQIRIAQRVRLSVTTKACQLSAKS
jgi:hypothetical protein